jgi:hypothetical protein
MATFGGGKYADMYYCNLEPTLERGIRVDHETEETADTLPVPNDCPLKDESFVITLKQSAK